MSSKTSAPALRATQRGRYASAIANAWRREPPTRVPPPGRRVETPASRKTRWPLATMPQHRCRVDARWRTGRLAAVRSPGPVATDRSQPISIGAPRAGSWPCRRLVIVAWYLSDARRAHAEGSAPPWTTRPAAPDTEEDQMASGTGPGSSRAAPILPPNGSATESCFHPESTPAPEGA